MKENAVDFFRLKSLPIIAFLERAEDSGIYPNEPHKRGF